jgi:hypothetical protein
MTAFDELEQLDCTLHCVTFLAFLHNMYNVVDDMLLNLICIYALFDVVLDEVYARMVTNLSAWDAGYYNFHV